MNRLTVGDTESVKAFKRTIRQMMEVFLRFTHRYWFHEVSNQSIAKSVFARLRRHLGNEELHAEVRNEVVDMNSYLDSDSARRQASTVLRLTVVTILGLIGTIATGVLGMNVFDFSAQGAVAKLLLFLLVLGATMVIAALTVAKSKRLADFLDELSDERVAWKSRISTLRRVLGRPPSGRA
jgi:membrane protein YqaA with SNARE-associated domain